MENYLKLLADPRWQKKRLKIFERDDWTCRACWRTDLTLCVHHRWYIPDRKPWEYAEHILITLCDKCHEAVKPIVRFSTKLLPEQLRADLFAFPCALWNMPEDRKAVLKAFLLHPGFLKQIKHDVAIDSYNLFECLPPHRQTSVEFYLRQEFFTEETEVDSRRPWEEFASLPECRLKACERYQAALVDPLNWEQKIRSKQ